MSTQSKRVVRAAVGPDTLGGRHEMDPCVGTTSGKACSKRKVRAPTGAIATHALLILTFVLCRLASVPRAPPPRRRAVGTRPCTTKRPVTPTRPTAQHPCSPGRRRYARAPGVALTGPLSSYRKDLSCATAAVRPSREGASRRRRRRSEAEARLGNATSAASNAAASELHNSAMPSRNPVAIAGATSGAYACPKNQFSDVFSLADDDHQLR
jgi:hypothetical protein